MSSELLVIMVVAIVVFGPNKLPMLARHLSHALKHYHRFKQQASNVWQGYLNELQLQDNEQKAKIADQHYQLLDPNDPQPKSHDKDS